MSRAFVNESDSDYQDDDLPEIRNPLPRGARNYMTPQGAERMQRELSALTSVERPRAAAEVVRLGTAGTNAERDALALARRRLREIDRRVEYLRGLSAVLEVVDPQDQDPERVAFGATVTVREEGEIRRVSIVGVEESDPGAGLVSWISPVAKALAGARAGDIVTVRLPKGDSRLKVERIDYER